jgi:hypothetical protein
MLRMEAEIRTFLADNFPLGEDPSSLPADGSLLEAGIIEETYGIRVEDDELLPENLDSIERIVSFVERKRAAASAA